MASWLGQLIASMVDVPEEEWDPRFRLALTTISSRATPFTPNTTRSCKQDYASVKALPSTSQLNPASSAPTSSNTPESGGSLYYVNYKGEDGWQTEGGFSIPETANATYDALIEIYRYVNMVKEDTVTTREIIRDSSAV